MEDHDYHLVMYLMPPSLNYIVKRFATCEFKPLSWTSLNEWLGLSIYRNLQAGQLSSAISLVVAAKKAKNYAEKLLKVSAGVLLKNPDVYTLWNFRREAFKHAVDSGSDVAELTGKELNLTQQCLLEQPKSYGTWHHRKWVLDQGSADLDEELELVDKCVHAYASFQHAHE